jgi:hypothetical protein
MLQPTQIFMRAKLGIFEIKTLFEHYEGRNELIFRFKMPPSVVLVHGSSTYGIFVYFNESESKTPILEFLKEIISPGASL